MDSNLYVLIFCHISTDTWAVCVPLLPEIVYLENLINTIETNQNSLPQSALEIQQSVHYSISVDYSTHGLRSNLLTALTLHHLHLKPP